MFSAGFNFILILGQDIIGYFNKWKNYKDILKDYKIYVFQKNKLRKKERRNYIRII